MTARRLDPHARAELALDRLLEALERYERNPSELGRVSIVARYREYRKWQTIAEHSFKSAIAGAGGSIAYKRWAAKKREEARKGVVSS